MEIAAGIFSLLSNGVKGFFGFKQAQADAIGSGLKVLGDVVSSDGQRDQAVAQIISAEASSGYWLAACIRPLILLVLLILVVAYWFGYAPPHINDALSPMMSQIFDLLKLGLGGYVGGRTLEKIVQSVSMSGVLKSYVNKKLM